MLGLLLISLGCSLSYADVTYRVSPVYGGRRADQSEMARVTCVSDEGSVPSADWAYSEQFQNVWGHLHVGTKLAPENGLVDVGRGKSLNVQIPNKGDGIRAIVFGDICLNGPPWCQGQVYDIENNLPNFINSIVDYIDVVAIVGDNFYDNAGNSMQGFFNRLSLAAQAKLFLTCPGNHDFWQNGSPGSASSGDEFGYGFMQYYGQDSIWAAENDLSRSPWNNERSGFSIANWKNFFSYSIVGNVGFIEFSGAHSWDDQKDAFDDACTYMIENVPSMVILLGHWNGGGFGALLTTSAAFYNLYDGKCSPLQDRMRYIKGHTHENYPENDGKGFLLGATGFVGANYWGVGLIDTHGGVNHVRYFQLGENNFDKSGDVIQCIEQSGIAGCGTLWQEFTPSKGPLTTGPPHGSSPSTPAPCSKWGWRFYDGYDISDHDLSSKPGGDRNSCQQECRDLEACVGYSWFDGVCYFKDGNIELLDIFVDGGRYSALLC